MCALVLSQTLVWKTLVRATLAVTQAVQVMTHKLVVENNFLPHYHPLT